MDGWSDGPNDRQTDKVRSRVTWHMTKNKCRKMLKEI